MAMRRSSRRSARSSSRSSSRGGRGSQRGVPAGRSGGVGEDGEERPERPQARKAKGGGSELMICMGVLGVLLVAVGVFYKIRSDELSTYNNQKQKRLKNRTDNINTAYQAFQKAERLGKPFVLGDMPGLEDKELQGKLIDPLKSDSKIYNIIFNRVFKGKAKNDETQQVFMDTTRTSVDKRGKSEFKSKITMTYGTVNNGKTPVFLAEKTYKPEEGDKVNKGGRITVIVLAKEEKRATGQ